jgi:hypothetical protein
MTEGTRVVRAARAPRASARGRAAAPQRPADAVLALQRSAGNAAVRKLLRAPPEGWDKFNLDDERKKFVERHAKAPIKTVEKEWQAYLLGLGDPIDKDRGWPADATEDPHPLKLRILAFQRGEQFIHALAMILEPDATVEIVYDTDSKYGLYRVEGVAEGLTSYAAAHHTYTRLHGEASSKSEGESMIALRSKALADALGIRAYLIDLGIDRDRIKVCGVSTTRKLDEQNPNRATNIVTDHMRRHPNRVRNMLKARLPRTEEAQARVLATLADSKIDAGEQCVLLWCRATGRSPGGAPEFDTPEQFLVEIAKRLYHDSGKKRTICLIGDKPPGRTLQELEGWGIPVNTYLIKYWEHHKLSYREQLQFVLALHHYARCVSIGIESGILELPAVLGLPTIYLEPASVRNQKGNRWRDFWATFGRTGAPQRRAMLTMARVLFTSSHLGFAEVTTGIDLLERSTIAVTSKPSKVQGVPKLLQLLELRPKDPALIVEKWEAINKQLREIMPRTQDAKLALPADERDAALQGSIFELTRLCLHEEELKRISRLVDVMSPIGTRLRERPAHERRPNVEAIVEPTATFASGVPPWGVRRRPRINPDVSVLLDPPLPRL